jgi:hypothetical protein
MRFRYPVDYRQPQAGARVFRGEERIEHALQKLRGDTGPVILDTYGKQAFLIHLRC